MDNHIAGLHYSYRHLTPLDVEACAAIEAECSDEPWSDKDFAMMMAEPFVTGKVATIGNEVVGFIIYEYRKSKLCLLNLCVARRHRRNLVGSTLLAIAKSKCNRNRSTFHAVAPVRDSQFVQFLTVNGFEMIPDTNDGRHCDFIFFDVVPDSTEVDLDEICNALFWGEED